MRIINISYRLPVSFKKKNDQIELKSSSGGLVSAILSLKKNEDELHWVGVADFPLIDYQNGKDLYLGEFKLHPIFLDKTINSGFYSGFSNGVIWPLFHYFPSFVEFNAINFNYYMEANRIIAKNVCETLLENDDIIWIHDYQLLPLADMIREMKPKVKIGFFLHIPFPSYELIRLLPKYCRDVLVQSMLGADLIGFHAYEYAQHFLHTVQMIKGIQHKQFVLLYKNRDIKIDVFPISINYENFNMAFLEPKIEDERNKLKNLYSGKKIIFSVDRLDYTKGIMYRLQGFSEFLRLFPEWREKIVFLLVAVPSRADLKRYKERKQMIEVLISEINGKYGNLKWTPIVYKYGSVEFQSLLGLYTSCDIALISPLRDGMNLVAKEFIASRNDEDGVLLLSDMTGAAKELTDALLFNPLDENEIALKIKAAIDMPTDERKTRMKNLRTQVKTYNVEKWSQDFMETLNEVCNSKSFPETLCEEKTKEIIAHFQVSQKRLILLDYDGTLTSFEPTPELALPSRKLIDLLTNLGNNPKNILVLVSGRDRNTLDTWFGKLPLILIAEHGTFIKKSEWKSTITDALQWKEGVLKIMKQFALNTSGAFLEEKTYSICWHYRNVEELKGFAQSRELINLLNDYLVGSGASIIDGNKVIEIKPAQINKGSAIQLAFDVKEYDFCIAMGDDQTDEDLFAVVAQYKGITVKVGQAASKAKYRLETIQMVHSLLEKLI